MRIKNLFQLLLSLCIVVTISCSQNQDEESLKTMTQEEVIRKMSKDPLLKNLVDNQYSILIKYKTLISDDYVSKRELLKDKELSKDDRLYILGINSLMIQKDLEDLSYAKTLLLKKYEHNIQQVGDINILSQAMSIYIKENQSNLISLKSTNMCEDAANVAFQYVTAAAKEAFSRCPTTGVEGESCMFEVLTEAIDSMNKIVADMYDCANDFY